MNNRTIKKMGKVVLVLLVLFFAGKPCYSQNDDDFSVQESSVSYFDSIYAWNVPPVKSRKVDDSLLRKLKNDDDYWYANTELEKKEAPRKKQERKSLFDQAWFRTLSWFIIIGGFIAIVIAYLASSNINLFRRTSTSLPVKDEGEVPEDIFDIDYVKEIREAVIAGDYRSAVRMHYLWMLKEMSEKNIIDYQYGKTNSDYLFQVSGTSYYKDFFKLTRLFDYTWYGHFQISENAFHAAQHDFATFKKQFPS